MIGDVITNARARHLLAAAQGLLEHVGYGQGDSGLRTTARVILGSVEGPLGQVKPRPGSHLWDAQVRQDDGEGSARVHRSFATIFSHRSSSKVQLALAEAVREHPEAKATRARVYQFLTDANQAAQRHTRSRSRTRTATTISSILKQKAA